MKSILTTAATIAFFALSLHGSVAKLNDRGQMLLDEIHQKLNRLPRHKAPYSLVKSLVTKLVKLDSKNADEYLSLGI